jgi:PAS domain-containing protein
MATIVQSLLQSSPGAPNNGAADATVAPSAPTTEQATTPPREHRLRSSVSLAIPSYDHHFDNLNDAVFIHDLDRHLQVNQVTCERLGYTRSELLQIRVQQIDTPESAAYFDKAVRIVVPEGSLLLESCHRRTDGSFPRRNQRAQD